MTEERWIYRFDGVEVDPAAHRVSRDGVDLAVEPKAYAVLVALLEQAGRALERDALLDRVWGHRHVTPGVLNRVVAQLRKALGDDAEHPRYIQTLHGLGYRFVGAVERLSMAPDPAPATEAAPLLPAAPQAPDEDAPVAGAHPHRHPHPHWRLRYFALASLLALAVVALGFVWERRQAPPPEASIAVLPFASLSTDPDDAYFAEGLATELHDALAGVPGMIVAAPLSPGDVRRDDDPRRLGKDLGVSALLDANVRREGGRVRINVRLVDARSGYTLWSRRYDRTLSRVFETQASIAEDVVGSLLGTMPKSRSQLESRLAPTRNTAAFDAYLHGLASLLGRSAPRDVHRAAADFRAALDADPGFARAQAGLCRLEVARFQGTRNADAFEVARQACERARRMDPSLGEVDLALAELHHARGEGELAERYYRRAESDPARRPAVYVGLAILSMDRDQPSRAMAYFQQALRLRPGDASIHANIGYQHYLAGRMPDAIEAYRRSVALAPGDAATWSTLGGLYLADGQVDAAASALQSSIAAEPTYSAIANLGELRYQQGRYSEAAKLQGRATALSPTDYMPWGNLGDALQAAGDAAAARAAYAEGAKQVGHYLQIKPDDAKAVAALGWFRVNLGDRAGALAATRRSESIGSEPGEVALYNAQAWTRLGEAAQAGRRVADARKAGMPESRIAGNPFLARDGAAMAR